MKVFYIFIFYLALLTGCDHGYKFWHISKFNIVDSALKDGEEIKLLYCSQGPDDNRDQKYYIQIVAVSQKTGDTVNILTCIHNGFSKADEDKVFNYFDQNNIASKISGLDTDQLLDPSELDKARKGEPEKITNVARDPKFDKIADNKFPTVIGTIGTLTQPK